MTAALATIVFLSAAWFSVVAVARSIEPHLEQMKRALRAEPLPSYAPVELRVKARYQPARNLPNRAMVRQPLRAAA